MSCMKNLKGFTEFIAESAHRQRRAWLKAKGLLPDHGLRGETIEDFAVDLAEIFELCPNLETVLVPGFSNASTPINIKVDGKQWNEWDRAMDKEYALADVVKDLTDMANHMESKGQIMTFSIWHLELTDRSPMFRLEKELVEFGGSGEYQDIDTGALIKFLKQNPEIAERVIGLNITKDSKADRDFAAAMSRGDFGSLD